MTTTSAGSGPETDSAEFERLFVAMARIRSFEDAVMRAFTSGEIRGTTHLCSGQEAASVGVCEALGPNDVVAATYRGHGAALPSMERLYEHTEETVFLSVLREREAVCIERIEGRWVQSMALTLGGGLPLHIGAGPRALLAFLGESAWMEYLAGGDLAPFTAHSISDPDALLADLRLTRERGYAVSDEDVVVGMAALGAPIFDYRGKVRAALSFSGPKPSVLGERREENIEAILTAARQTSRGLGFDPAGGRTVAA